MEIMETATERSSLVWEQAVFLPFFVILIKKKYASIFSKKDET